MPGTTQMANLFYNIGEHDIRFEEGELKNNSTRNFKLLLLKHYRRLPRIFPIGERHQNNKIKLMKSAKACIQLALSCIFEASSRVQNNTATLQRKVPDALPTARVIK
jgi:hypothetical protein